MATATPVRCSLAEIADHQFVTVTARIAAVDFMLGDSRRPWAVIALVDGAVLVDVQVYPTTYALCSQHLRVGVRVTVSAEVGQDYDGVYLAAHDIQIGASA